MADAQRTGGGGFHQWALTIGGLVTAAAAVIGVIAVRSGGSSSSSSPPTTTAVAPAVSEPAACGAPSLKGSTNAYGDRIFNEPTSPRYDEIAATACFGSRAEAEAAGYRRYDSCLASAPVKGRVFTQDGAEAKWFYEPTTSGYDYVNPEQCFPTAAAAQAAGYTAKP